MKALLVAVVLAAGSVACGDPLTMAQLTQTADPGGGGSAVDFTKVTPIPPRPIPSLIPPQERTPTHCQLPEDERESPDLPPLSCRNTGAEPPAGAIPTIDPAAVPTAATAKAGFKVIDNRLFRLTVEVPDTWYSNMRPEGGAFSVFDPIATEANAKQVELTGGIGLHFSAARYVASAEGLGDDYILLEKPNATFGGSPGAIADLGTAVGERWIRAVFRKGDVLYAVDAFVAQTGRSKDEIQADIDTVYAIFATITPY